MEKMIAKAVKEKVIFRREYNQYLGEMTYLAVFPQCPANCGHYSAVPFYFNGESVCFEPFCEVSWDYYYKDTWIVHKNDSIIEKLLSAIENRYGEEYQVAEKITSRNGG